ncbi:hypothetical protein G3M48_006468 [Beauveria asiatica]|uniref:Uncharacterized protein n=1 Tax=Beauveria asiatica TaxID=1069075 RepID=A0AAW0S646_9HYPO
MRNPSSLVDAIYQHTTRIDETSKFTRNHVHARAGSAGPCSASWLRVFTSQAPTAVADVASPALTNNKGGKMGGVLEAPPRARRPATSLIIRLRAVRRHVSDCNKNKAILAGHRHLPHRGQTDRGWFIMSALSAPPCPQVLLHSSLHPDPDGAPAYCFIMHALVIGHCYGPEQLPCPEAN